MNRNPSIIRNIMNMIPQSVREAVDRSRRMLREQVDEAIRGAVSDGSRTGMLFCGGGIVFREAGTDEDGEPEFTVDIHESDGRRRERLGLSQLGLGQKLALYDYITMLNDSET